MENSERKEHWENVYQNKALTDVSWYQPVPETSLNLVKELHLKKDAAIIDIGGGDSFLTDHLLELGYTDLTVLDISEKAIERAKTRLGDKARNVKWIAADVSTYVPGQKYDLWHDRAAFHFLTGEEKIREYVSLAEYAVLPGGHMIMGTFSEMGPEKCSGLEVRQYSQLSMSRLFEKRFEPVRCFNEDHLTPFGTTQNFVYCRFKKR